MKYKQNAKMLIYAIACVSLAIISCGTTTTLPQIPKSDAIPQYIGNTYAETNIPTSEAQLMTVCNSGGLHVRAEADPSADIVGELQDGDSVTVTGSRVVAEDMGLWWKIDGGYVNARFICEVRK